MVFCDGIMRRISCSLAARKLIGNISTMLVVRSKSSRALVRRAAAQQQAQRDEASNDNCILRWYFVIRVITKCPSTLFLRRLHRQALAIRTRLTAVEPAWKLNKAWLAAVYGYTMMASNRVK